MKEFPKDSQEGQNSFAHSEAKPKEPKEFLEDIAETRISPVLGITHKQAIAIWEGKGKPTIHLGPGENCFDLGKLLSRTEVSLRHLEAVKAWLKEHEGGDEC